MWYFGDYQNKNKLIEKRPTAQKPKLSVGEKKGAKSIAIKYRLLPCTIPPPTLVIM